MARWFNIGGPCNAAKHYMLPATERLPDVASLIRKEQYFVVHAPRQCGKTTGFLAFANEINAKGEAVAMYCSLETVQEFPKAAFQDFWRENADMNQAPFDYNEAYPHIVLQAFLQRVINGGGEIVREMALGKGALDLGVVFRKAKYAVEVKLKYNYEKNLGKSHDQVCRYMDHLGVSEGWLVVFDPDLSKPWDGKISTTDIPRDGKTIHLVRC